MALLRLLTTLVFIVGASMAALDASFYLQHLNSTEEILALSPRVDDLPPCWLSNQEKYSYERRKVIRMMIPMLRQSVKDLSEDDGSGWFAALKETCSHTLEISGAFDFGVPRCQSLSQRKDVMQLNAGITTREDVIERYELFMKFVTEFTSILKQQLKFLESHITTSFSLDDDPKYQECLQKEVGVLETHLQKVEARERGARIKFNAKKAPFVSQTDNFRDWRDTVVLTETMKPLFDLHCDEVDFISGVLDSINACLQVAIEEKKNRPVTERSATSDDVLTTDQETVSEAIISTSQSPSSNEIEDTDREGVTETTPEGTTESMLGNVTESDWNPTSTSPETLFSESISTSESPNSNEV